MTTRYEAHQEEFPSLRSEIVEYPDKGPSRVIVRCHFKDARFILEALNTLREVQENTHELELAKGPQP